MKGRGLSLNSFDRLGDDQKNFIRKKVRELGSRDAALKHYLPEYGSKSLVTRYAIKIIREIWGIA